MTSVYINTTIDRIGIFKPNRTTVARGEELPTWSRFVETHLVSCEHGRIGKFEMMRIAKNYFPFTVIDISMLDMIDALTKNGVVYAKNQSEMNVKGVFVGCT